MKLPKSVRSVVCQLAEEAAPVWIGADGVLDMRSLIEDVGDRLAGDEPDIDALLRAEARTYAIDSIVHDWARFSHVEIIEPEPDLFGEAAPRRCVRARMAVPRGSGPRIWKELLDLTRGDVELLIPERQKAIAADAQVLAWLKEKRARFVQLGLPMTATVRDLLQRAS
jgi:hypothetical protein